MKLDELYGRITEAVSSLDCESIRPGFRPLKFALNDDEKCFFDGAYIEKTDVFCANTSIDYNGEQIAIWKVDGEPDIPVLTSKIVHEMFHGLQTREKWNCWADETEALYRYKYNADALSLRLRENDLLLRLLDRFDDTAYRELLSHRRLRSEKYPYEFDYESRIEEIEGSATYVEWAVLGQLDENAAAAMKERMRAAVTKPERLLPVRISCYYTGALMINAMKAAGSDPLSSAKHPAIFAALKNVRPSDGNYPGIDARRRTAANAVAEFDRESERIVGVALEMNEVAVEGPLELLCVNIYDARFFNGYITSRYFLLYRDTGGEHTVYGDFVLEMSDAKTISRVYRWRAATGL